MRATFLRFAVTVLSLSIVHGAAAQTCADPDARTFWRSLNSFDADESIARPEQAEVQAKLEQVVGFFAGLYPRAKAGETTVHSGSITAYDEVVDGPRSYELESEYYPRHCDASTGRLDDLDFLMDKGLETVVDVNSLHLLLRELENFSIDGQPVYSLAHRTGTMAGHPVYRSEWVRSGSAILFTRGGRLPVKPVSRRQYLDAVRAKELSTVSETTATLDKLEADFRRQLEEARQMPPGESRDQLVETFERGLADIQSQRPVGDAKLSAAVKEDLAVIDAYVASHSADDLAQQAITYHSPVFAQGTFPSADDEGAYGLVQIDYDYFNPQLSRDAAQLVVLNWGWEADDADPATLEWRAKIEAKLPLEALQGLIDK